MDESVRKNRRRERIKAKYVRKRGKVKTTIVFLIRAHIKEVNLKYKILNR